MLNNPRVPLAWRVFNRARSLGRPEFEHGGGLTAAHLNIGAGAKESLISTESEARSPVFTPNHTYIALLVVQSLHLLHHRLAKRHISFAEVISAAVLCVPPFVVLLPAWLFIGAHLSLIAIQLVGSFWIKKLSPEWTR